MIKYLFLLSVVIFCLSCSEEENNPSVPDNTASGFLRARINNVSWYADKITAYRQSNTLHIIGTQDSTGTPQFISSEMRFRIINISQPGLYGIGEDEPGFIYFVKAQYILVSGTGLGNVTYTAYYQNYSIMDISLINTSNLIADFVFRAYVDSTTSVNVTDGAINIRF